MRCLTASSSIYSDYLCSEPVRRYTRGFLRQPEEKWCGNGAFLDLRVFLYVCPEPVWVKIAFIYEWLKTMLLCAHAG
jgi:hypothetical protein